MKKLTLIQFLERANQKHNNFYDYSKVEYINSTTLIAIICPIHGEFKQRPDKHLLGNKCRLCSNDKLSKEKLKCNKIFIEQANQIHNYKYDYSLVEYSGAFNKIIIICPEHGRFEQQAKHHIKGIGCKKCGYSRNSIILRYTTEEFIKKAKQVHKDGYDYLEVKYIDSKTKIKIICKKCNKSFFQEPAIHLYGQGCPVCNISKGEIKIKNWLDKNNINYTTQESFKEANNPCRNPETNAYLKFDFYLPDYKLCIEYDGVQHFKPWSFTNNRDPIFKKKNLEYNQYRDKIKTQYCLNNSFRLLRIPYTKFKNIEKVLENTVYGSNK